MRNTLALVLAVAGLAALVSAPAAFAAWQDTNLCDVPSPDFPTIQSAVDQPLCFTIRLRVQTFTEQLTIRRSLTLTGQTFTQGTEQFASTLRPPEGMVGTVLINVVGPRTRLKIKRLVVEGPATGAGLIGLRAGRDTRVTIRDCAFRDIRPPRLDARGGFVAMRLGGPLQPNTKVGITGHSITNCSFDGYQSAAIMVEGVGTTALIATNLIEASPAGALRPAGTAAPIGVYAFGGASVTVDGNNIRGNARAGRGGTAVLLGGAAAGSVVSANNIDRNDLGVRVEGTNGTQIYRNGLTENYVGLALGLSTASDSNLIRLNRIEKGGHGLQLGDSSSNTISSNDLLVNTLGHGALLSAASTQNKLDRNRSDNNRGFGFLDLSSGSGTAGTANTYTSNICGGNNRGGGGSSPAGLCRREAGH